MRAQRRIVALAALSAVAVVLPLTAQPANAAPDQRRSAVADAKPSWVAGAKAIGDAAGSERIEVKLYLALRDQAGLERAVESVSSPDSPQYGGYLTPQQFRARYAPTDATVAQVRAFLTSFGLTATAMPENRSYIAASGTVEAVEKAFGTSLKTYRKDGQTLRAAAGPATVPTSLAGTVIAVSGLASRGRAMAPRHTVDAPAKVAKAAAPRAASRVGTHAPPPDAFVNAPPCSAYFGQKTAKGTPPAYGKVQSYAPCGYTPAQLQGAYGLSTAVRAGADGRGVKVAITDAYAAPTIAEDADTYATKHGQAAFRRKQLTQVLPPAFRFGYDDKENGDQCGEQGWYGEETLDVEAVHAVAPRADVVYVASASCDDGDFLDALTKIVDGHLADIVSNSWGSTGETTPDDLRKAYHETFLQAALEGIGIYFSSGDSGDNSGTNPGGVASVDSPVSDPLVTAVGGTALAIDARNRRTFETGWGTGKSVLTDGAWTPALPGPFTSGAGGGTSQVFDQPFYQRRAVPAEIANRYGKPARALPDIAALADPNTGMRVGETQTFPDGSVKYSEYRIGGTSLSSPLMAGIMAIADQVGGRAHGFANPAFYRLAGSRALYDVKGAPPVPAVVRVDYKNLVNDSEGLVTSIRSLNVTQSIKVRPGYDDVTGVGTPNGLAFLAALALHRY
jgi:subtilase family serine protease